jgi:hypothetical protein
MNRSLKSLAESRYTRNKGMLLRGAFLPVNFRKPPSLHLTGSAGPIRNSIRLLSLSSRGCLRIVCRITIVF